jgi:chromosome partitioning protein
MAKTILIGNQKGGVGKTTTTINLSAELANLGKRVLLIDLDSQAALTASFGIDIYKIEKSITTVLFDENLNLEEAIQPVRKNLFLIPADDELLSKEYLLLSELNRTKRLKNALDKVSKQFDLILIDTPPNLGLLTLNGLVAADYLMIPVQTDYLALRGLRPLLETVWTIRESKNQDLKLLGIVPTMTHPDSNHSQAIMEELTKVFKKKVFTNAIPYDPSIAIAPSRRKTIRELNPNSDACLAYQALALEVLIRLT